MTQQKRQAASDYQVWKSGTHPRDTSNLGGLDWELQWPLPPPVVPVVSHLGAECTTDSGHIPEGAQLQALFSHVEGGWLRSITSQLPG